MGRRGKDRRRREKAREFMEEEAHMVIHNKIPHHLIDVLARLDVFKGKSMQVRSLRDYGYYNWKFEAAMGWRDAETIFN